MVRKVTANVYMTLDGRGAFPQYPGWDRPSREPGALFREMWIARYGDVTTVVMGRRSFLGHQKVWSGRARKPDDPPYMHDYSNFLDRTEKVCLSRHLTKTDWEKSRIAKGDLGRIIGQLKRKVGGEHPDRRRTPDRSGGPAAQS
ncbi:bifunctional deaminase-reductase domain protein, partial [mine drainage metagenome]